MHSAAAAGAITLFRSLWTRPVVLFFYFWNFFPFLHFFSISLVFISCIHIKCKSLYLLSYFLTFLFNQFTSAKAVYMCGLVTQIHPELHDSSQFMLFFSGTCNRAVSTAVLCVVIDILIYFLLSAIFVSYNLPTQCRVCLCCCSGQWAPCRLRCSLNQIVKRLNNSID